MKNIFKTLSILALVLTFNSCQDSQNTVDDVLQYETGAILRTISVDNSLLNSSDPDSPFIVQVEEQDEQGGGLFAAVQIYVQMRDLTPDNGITTTENTFVKSIPASEFTPGPVGLPRGTVSSTFGELTAAMGLSSAEYFAGDIYIIELRVELTDGRVYGVSSAGSSVTGGYFSSPFAYNALLTCNPLPGTYTLDMQDAYGDGWQSTGIEVNIDGVSTFYKVPEDGCCTNNTASASIVVPVGTETLSWAWAGDSWPDEVTFQIYAPDGSPLGAFIGENPISDYGCGCSILSVPGIETSVAEVGLLPITLCL